MLSQSQEKEPILQKNFSAGVIFSQKNQNENINKEDEDNRYKDTFRKTANFKSSNTAGEAPVILFKKEHPVYSQAINISIKESNYVTDGGYKKKLNKCYSIRCPQTNLNKKLHDNMINTKSKMPYSKSMTSMRGMINKENMNKSSNDNFKSSVNFNNKLSHTTKINKSESSIFRKKNTSIKKKSTNSSQNNNSQNNLNNNSKKLLTDEEKAPKIKALFDNALAIMIKDYNTNTQRKTKEEEKNERRQKVLEANEIQINEKDISLSDSVSNDTDNTQNKKTMVKSKSTLSHFSTKKVLKNNYIKKLNTSRSEATLIKKELKPKVNIFEWENKIKRQRRKISNNNNSQNTSNNNTHNSNLNNNSHSTEHNYEPNSENTENAFHPKKKEENKYKDIKKYMKEKKIKYKKKEEDKEMGENTKNLEQYKNLYSLYLDKKNTTNSMPNNNSNKTSSTFRFNKKRKKVRNDYYVGTEGSVNNSTVIDPNDYYCQILSAQQLLVADVDDLQMLNNNNEDNNNINNLNNNDINNEEDINEDDYNDINNNSNNTNKGKLNQISQKLNENSNNNSNSKSQPNSSNKKNENPNMNKIKKKVAETFIETNKIFNDENIKKYLNNSSNSINNNNINNTLKSKSNKNKNTESINESLDGDKENNDNENIDNNDNENIKSEKKEVKEPNKKSKNLNLDTSNEDNNIKDKDLPSLTHTYNNTNPNKKIEIKIEPRTVLNLVEIIKLLTQRRIFYNLYEIYINELICQRYTIAFAYFTAIIKQTPFRVIEEYGNYKTYFFAFRTLFKPFIKKYFHMLINKCNFNKKIESFEKLLNKIIKLRALENISLYADAKNPKEENKNDSEDCDDDCAPAISKRKSEDVTIKSKDNEEQDNFNKTNKSNKTNNSNKSNKKNNNEEKEDLNKNSDCSLENSVNHSAHSLNQKIKKLDNSPKSVSSQSLYEKKLENNNLIDDELKMNTYIYESFSDKSYELQPNSVDNDRLHKLQMRILENEQNGLDTYSENNNMSNDRYQNNQSEGSISSTNKIKSLNEITKMKPGLDLSKSFENLSREGNDNLKKSLSNKSLSRNNSKENLNKSNLSNQSNLSKTSNKSNKNKEKLSHSELDIKMDTDNEIKDKDNANNKDNCSPTNNINKLNLNLPKKTNVIDDSEYHLPSSPIENDEFIKNRKIEKEQKDLKNSEDFKDKDIPIEENIEECINDNVKDKNELANTEQDISIDKETNTNIDWEYSIGNSNKNKTKNDNLDNKEIKDKDKDKDDLGVKKFDLNKGLFEKKLDKGNKKNNKDYSKGNDDDEYADFENDISNNSLDNSENIVSIMQNEKNKDNKDNKELKTEDKNNTDSTNSLINTNNDKSRNTNTQVSVPENNNTDKSEKKSEDKSEKPDKIEDQIVDPENNLPSNEPESIKTQIKQSVPEDKNETEKDKVDSNPQDSTLIKAPETNAADKEVNPEQSPEIKSETKSDEDKSDNITKSEPEKKVEEKQEENLQEQLEKLKSELLKEKSMDEISNDILEELFNDLLATEITNKNPIVTKKRFKYENPSTINLSRSGSLNNSQTGPLMIGGREAFPSLGNFTNLQLLNESIMSSYSANSIFNKTVKDKKKTSTLNLYTEKIGPLLIKNIKQNVIDNYEEIYDNISVPMHSNPLGLMASLVLQDAELLKENYKRLDITKDISDIINIDKLLKEFEPINKKIRNEDNVAMDNYYDNFLNECLIETAIELINKERMYGDAGLPLPWSSRTRDIKYKYDRNDPYPLANLIEKELNRLLIMKIGLISDNFDYMNIEQINNEREKKIIDNLNEELCESESQWKNLEMEETQIKVDTAEAIMDQLYNEVVEILEHIQFSRKRPDLYQNKSIYACEEIPKLNFQMDSTDEENEEDNDVPNIS